MLDSKLYITLAKLRKNIFQLKNLMRALKRLGKNKIDLIAFANDFLNLGCFSKGISDWTFHSFHSASEK